MDKQQTCHPSMDKQQTCHPSMDKQQTCHPLMDKQADILTNNRHFDRQTDLVMDKQADILINKLTLWWTNKQDILTSNRHFNRWTNRPCDGQTDILIHKQTLWWTNKQMSRWGKLHRCFDGQTNRPCHGRTTWHSVGQTNRPVVLSAQCLGEAPRAEQCEQRSWSWCGQQSGDTETPALLPPAVSPWSVLTQNHT